MKKYCRAFPCSSFAAAGSAFCHEHKRPPAPKVTDSFYLSVRWRRFRNWYIGKHPLCARCWLAGCPVTATVVDHVVELKDGGAALDEANVQSLCASCHNKKTAEERAKRAKNHRKAAKSNRVGSHFVS